MHYDHDSKPSRPSRFESRRFQAATIGVVAVGVLLTGCAVSLHNPRSGTSFEQSKSHEYPLHPNIPATEFWVGEGATEESGYIPNDSSAWKKNWVEAYGGVDTPDRSRRCGYRPCDFIPKENPFYIALPFSDHTTEGMKSPKELRVIPWYDEAIPLKPGESPIQDRWVEISSRSPDGKTRTAYAQWEDVGPVNDNDVEYVFGNKPPAFRSGIDLSPATADYLGMDGTGFVSWRFVEAQNVPKGEWTKTITKSAPSQ